MAKSTRKLKCPSCGVFFPPDYRNRGRQRYCSEPVCRKAAKAASQKRWLNKPENRDYFRGLHNVRRVQEWREAHPVISIEGAEIRTANNIARTVAIPYFMLICFSILPKPIRP